MTKDIESDFATAADVTVKNLPSGTYKVHSAATTRQVIDLRDEARHRDPAPMQMMMNQDNPTNLWNVAVRGQFYTFESVRMPGKFWLRHTKQGHDLKFVMAGGYEDETADWLPVPAGGTSFRVKHSETGLYLTVLDPDVETGDILVLEPKVGPGSDAHQRWHFSLQSPAEEA